MSRPAKKPPAINPKSMPKFTPVTLDGVQRQELNDWIEANNPQSGEVLSEMLQRGYRLSLKRDDVRDRYSASATTPVDHHCQPHECFSVAHKDPEKTMIVLGYVMGAWVEKGNFAKMSEGDDW